MKAQRTTLFIFCLIFLAGSVVGQDGIDQKTERSNFELASFSSFVTNDLSMSEANSSLKPYGFATRRVHGLVVDHDGKPVVGAMVALVKHIGFSDRCFEENFDLTDDQGRFVVEGQFDKVRVIVRQGQWAIHRETLTAGQTTIRIRLPELATCRIKVDKELLRDAAWVYVRTPGDWAGMNSMGGTVTLDESGAAVIPEMIPTDYCISVNRTVPIGTKTETGVIEIGSFTLGEGEDKAVDLKRSGKRTLHGKLPFANGETPLVLKVFRQCGKNRHSSTMMDIVPVNQDGSFETDPLPSGSYLLRVFGPKQETNNIRGFSSGLHRLREMHNRRIVVPAGDKPIRVDWNKQGGSPVRVMVEKQLELQMYNTNFQIQALLNYVDRPAVATELVNILAEENAPQEWYDRIGYTLVGMLDEDGVVDAILTEVDKSAETGRGAIWWLMRADKKFPEIISCLEKHRHCLHINMRHAVNLVLLQIIQKDVHSRETILPWLIEALDDPNPNSRYQIARAMGWIKATQAVAKLKQLTKDSDARVRVVAAIAIAEITKSGEDKEVAIKLLTQRLFSKSLHGQVMAAQGLQNFEDLPPIAIKALMEKARIEPSKNYRNPVKLMNNSLRESAVQTLKKVAPKALEELEEKSP